MAAIAIASEQHHKPKAVDAAGHEAAGKGLAHDKISIKSTPCERFSIRGYVATFRKLDRNTSWPFPQHLLEIRLKEAGNMALPPLEIPEYRWWNCKNCLGDISTSAESSLEDEYMRDAHKYMQDYDANIHHGCLMFGMYLRTSNNDLQEKQNMHHGTDVVETPTFLLKSSDAVGSSAHETDKENRDEEVVTDIMSEHKRTVPMELEKDKSEIANFKEKKSRISQCLSNFRNSEGFINMTEVHHPQQDEKATGPETGQAIIETMPFMLVSKTNEELGSKQNKYEALNIHCQARNSWENFSKNKNVFKEMGEKMKGKEMEQATSSILSSEIDANKLKNISNVLVSVAYGESAELGQQVLVKQNGVKTISTVVESLTVQTNEFSIQNKDDSHRATDDGNDAPCLSGNQNSCPEHMRINKSTKGKDCTDLSTSQASLEKVNVLLSELTGNLKVSESRSKRRTQKRRSIADIIACESSNPKIWNKKTQESKSADIMKENMCRTENNEHFHLKEDHMNDPKDTMVMPSKPPTKTNGISEVDYYAEMNNAILNKRHPEKITVTKKHHSIGIQSLDAGTVFFAKNSSSPSFSEAVTNALQLPQSTSHLASVWRDNALQHNFLNPEYGQRRNFFPEMEDEIPIDIVELMAKNQHQRGLSNPKHLHKRHNLQKDERRLKMKKTDAIHVNKHVEEGAGLKQNMVAPKSKAWPKQTGEENLQAFLRKHSGNDFLVDYRHIDVSGVNATDNLVISNKESITSDSCKSHLEMLQSTQWFNPWGNYSPDLVAPILDETNAACNLSFPIERTKSHVAITHCDQYGAISTNGSMALDSRQLLGASSYCGYMEIQKLCSEGAPALSYITNPVLPVFQNKSESFLNYNGYSHQNITNTDSPQILPRESSDLGVSGSKFNILSEHHKGNGIPNLSAITDGVSHPLYFNGQSNSDLLQQVNAQARQTSGKKYCFPSAPKLRLMGQSLSVPVTCVDKKSMAAENGDNINFSNLPHGSSQKHVTWSHPAACASSGVMDRYQNETFTSIERVFTVSEPIQDGTHMHEQIISSIKTIPPVPNFRPSGHLVSNGLSGISTSSCTVSGKGNVALESSLLRTKSSFHGTPLPGKKQKKGLPCTNGYNSNLQTFSIVPPASKNTKVVKGSSSTKGLRSDRPTPTSMHLNRYQTPAVDIYLQDGHQCLQSPWMLGSNPKQDLTKEPKKTKALNKENEESALCGKTVCNVEICNLNQNPAEINIEEDDGYNIGYEHLASSHRAFPHRERKINTAISQGQKRRRTLKKKHLQEFLGQKDGYVSDLANTNVDNLISVGQEVTSVKELEGNIT